MTSVLQCPKCGSALFTVTAASLSDSGQVVSYDGPATCTACGAPLQPTSAEDGSPDSRSVLRERAYAIASAGPGQWFHWKTYPSTHLDTARVAASDLRTGKIKTVAALVGPVDARTVRASDGTIRVEVTRTP